MSTRTQTTDESTNIKLIRCAIQDPELIEQVECELYNSDTPERKLISEALRKYFSETD